MCTKETYNKKVVPADRLSSVQEYYFSRKQKEVARLNAEGKDIISLAIGSPDMPPSKETIQVLCEQAQRPDTHGYQPTMGIPELREAMARFYARIYNVELDPATEIQPLIGSKEGILHTTLAMANAGDRVLVPNPGYPTYTSLTRLLGCEVVNYDLRPENNWQPDFGQLEQLAAPSAPSPALPEGRAGEGAEGEARRGAPGAKMLWVNYPNMPTGANAQMATYERLVRFAHDHGIVVVNDNPYSLIINRQPMSILQVDGAKECCIEFNSMSKSHNMPGWRVGMLATNAEWVSWILKVKSNIDSGTFRPMQLAAAAAYDNSDAWHEEFNYQNYARRRAIAEEIMAALGCEVDKDQVGMFLWGRIPGHYADCEELTERVLHEARVFITPGFIFGSNGNRYIRISLCAKDEKMREALERVRALKK